MATVPGRAARTGRPLHRVDIVDTNPFLAFALHELLREGRMRIRPGLAGMRWETMAERWDFGRDVVVVQAELPDIWPHALKIRALSRLGCRTLVIGDTGNEALVARAVEAGAVRVVDPATPLRRLVEHVQQVAQGSSGWDQAQLDLVERHPAPYLSDRRMQICCLYAARPDFTTGTIATILGLSEHTVRSHLAAVRRIYREHGDDTSDRRRLSATLREHGYLVGDLGRG